MKATKKLIKQLPLCILAAMLWTPASQANLIHNGSFEAVDEDYRLNRYGSDSTWQIYTELPSWDANRNLEVWQSGFNGVAAADGDRFVELNAHPRGRSTFSIFQNFNTQAGVAYDLSFFARKRGRGAEGFEVSVGDLQASINDHVRGEWTQYSFNFFGNGGMTQLRFSSLDGGRDTVGNFIDDVRVTAAVPEAPTLSILGLGLLSLFVARRTGRTS